MIKKVLIVCIRGYQRWISPLFPPTCRFQPTCSHYAIASLDRFGPFRGTALAVWRILRCNPWCRGGYDPVPEKFWTTGKTALADVMQPSPESTDPDPNHR
ncbi:MAG: membrane protein insertion efficiency factor YidD [Thermosynechococcaceae cyanobacterium]